MPLFTVTRQIAIDAGHRVSTHGSKCRHIHGHRYVIEAECAATTVQTEGEQKDMVVDFGFLKEEMMAVIDGGCDHGFIASIQDVALLQMFAPENPTESDWLETLREEVSTVGFALTTDTRLGSKLYVIHAIPTAEQLAHHWFERLAERVQDRSNGLARLRAIRVHETPNCVAIYSEA